MKKLTGKYAEAGPGSKYAGSSARWVQVSFSLSMLMASLDTSIANASLPSMARAFSASFPAAQWIVLSYLLAITSLIVSLGWLGDMVGRRRLLQVGILLFTAASLACGVAPTLGLLIASRAVQGAGAAIMMALSVALAGDASPSVKRGAAMGLLGTMSALGTSLGPSLGGMLVEWLGWRAIFLVNVPLGLLNVVLAWRYVPHDAPTPAGVRSAFDWPGTLLLAFTLAAYSLAMTIGGGRGVLLAALLAGTLVGLALFIAVESRSASPLLRLDVLRDPCTRASLVMSALVSTVIMATLVVGPFYLSRGLRLQPGAVGLVLSIGPLVAAMASVPAGRVVDRLGAGRMTIVGLIGMAGGCALLSLMPVGLGVLGYSASICVTTAGYAMFQTANTTSLMSKVAADQRGITSGMLSVSRNLGLISGASAMGAVFAFAAGSGDLQKASPTAVADGLHLTFAVGAMLLGGAIAIAVRSVGSARTLQGGVRDTCTVAA